VKFLIVDDNPADRELVIRKLRQVFDGAVFDEIGRGEEFETALEACDFDVVLTDYHLHWSDGLEVFRRIREHRSEVPVIMFTDSGNEEIAVEGMKRGLSDYLLKRHLERLPIAIRESLEKLALERKYAEARTQLRASQERYRRISELTSDYAFAYRVEEDGTLTREWMTDAFYRITGYTQEELDALGGWRVTLHPKDAHLAEAHRSRILANEAHTVEYRILTKGGEVRWLQVRGRPIWDEDQGRVVRLLGAATDITDQREAQRALVQAEKLSVAGRLAASLAHEINNPMQTVIGCLGLAEEELADHESVSELLQMAVKEMQRASRIVTELRDLGRKPTPQEQEPTDLGALIDRVLALSGKELANRGVEVDVRSGEDPIVVRGAPDRLHQVVLNLILNAADAMPEGGQLTISLEPTSSPEGATLAFEDTGVGIPPEGLDQLFDPFYTTKEDGVGLGLYVIQNIIDNHAGTIDVESEVGKGTTFRVWLPQGDAEATEPA
jgi:PAS domain S-box-containing protein